MARPVPAGSDAKAAGDVPAAARDVPAAAHGPFAVVTAVFELFEVVRIRATPDTIQREIAGLEGAVQGSAEGEAGEILAYAVLLYERGGTCWWLAPAELRATGRRDGHEHLDD